MAHAVSTRQATGGQTTLTHLVFTFNALMGATHHRSRSPPHKPSLATEHTIANIYQVMRKQYFLGTHALPPFLFCFPRFCLFFKVSLPSARNRKNTRDLDSCFAAVRYLQGLLKRGRRLRTTPPNQSRASPMIFAHSRFPAGNLKV